MADVISTDKIKLPNNLAEGIWQKAQTGSVIAALSQARPMVFGNTDIMTLDTFPKAEYVGEGKAKNPTDATFGMKTITPKKVQVTMRFDDEVVYADEDRQIGVLQTLADQGGVALMRALDLGAIHGINPLTGEAFAGITEKLVDTTNTVTAGKDAELDLEAAVGLVISDGFVPNGFALDTAYGWKIATTRYEDGRKKFPDMSLTNAPTALLGLNTATSDTVSASKEVSTPTKLLGIAGDWSTFAWGVQRDMGVELIRYGDPDGKGDLSRFNQVALRLEMIYGWAFLDLNAFSVIKSA